MKKSEFEMLRAFEKAMLEHEPTYILTTTKTGHYLDPATAFMYRGFRLGYRKAPGNMEERPGVTASSSCGKLPQPKS